MTPEQKFARARTHLVIEHPFFGALALRLKVEQDPKTETGDCDGTTIRYNPDWVDDAPFSKVQGMITHLVMHAAFLHPLRRGARNQETWDKACDYAINPLLVKAGFDLPFNTYNDPKYADMTAEQIYSLLPIEPDNKDGKGNGNGKGKGQHSPDDPGGDGGVSDSPNSENEGASAAQQRHEEAEWKVAVAQAAHVAKQQGKLPGDLERLLEGVFEAQLPWRDILRRFMTEKSPDDFSWSRGNRRFIGQGLYLPSRISEDAMGEVVVVIDTSGSIGQKELDEFGSEITGIVAETRPSKTRVIYCDAAIAHIDEFGPDDALEFKAHGGGGTDFRPPFNWLEKHGITPRVLVYLTDGYGPFPDAQDYPVMWVINNPNVIPPNGEHLILDV